MRPTTDLQPSPPRRVLANALRVLSMDAVQQANSGHPGAPMGMADIAEVLWRDVLVHNPRNPAWPNRDRFILSNGHASMLLYALLHLSGYDLSLDDIKQFRQLGSKTPGHPEYGRTPGVETTTGPLGQGLANAVGMALAERTLAAQFNRSDFPIVHHYTYVFVGDGCLMEGISHEACSLAGTLGLGKLIAIYDDNGISIDGSVAGWFTDNTPKRFEAYGWHVIPNVNGHDPDAIYSALEAARREVTRPSLICCKTVIGLGAPHKAGTADVHGAPLGPEEVAAARQQLDWPYEPFMIPDTIYAAWDARARGQQHEAAWQDLFAAYSARYPELAAEFTRRIEGRLPPTWADYAHNTVQQAQRNAENIASRVASQRALTTYSIQLPELFGGSADLSHSNNTLWSASRIVTHHQADGNYLHYGVREFAMCAILNGMALHKGFIPYGGTFLMFSDYARNALRVAALAAIPSIFVFTHDSIGLGEDGPTHQPIEHLGSLRLIPNLSLWRPADAVETAVAWKAAIERRNGPTALVFSRQKLLHQPRTREQLALIERGGYVLYDNLSEATLLPHVIVMATGSEVALAMQAATQLAGRIAVRVVSLPSIDVFEQQDKAYRDTVLPPTVTRRIAIEAAATLPWYKYVGLQGVIIGIDQFGESAPAETLFTHFGLTVEHLVTRIEALGTTD